MYLSLLKFKFIGPSTLMLFTVNTVSSEEAMLCGRKINPAIIKIKVIFFKLCFVFFNRNNLKGIVTDEITLTSYRMTNLCFTFVIIRFFLQR